MKKKLLIKNHLLSISPDKVCKSNLMMNLSSNSIKLDLWFKWKESENIDHYSSTINIEGRNFIILNAKI